MVCLAGLKCNDSQYLRLFLVHWYRVNAQGWRSAEHRSVLRLMNRNLTREFQAVLPGKKILPSSICRAICILLHHFPWEQLMNSFMMADSVIARSIWNILYFRRPLCERNYLSPLVIPKCSEESPLRFRTGNILGRVSCHAFGGRGVNWWWLAVAIKTGIIRWTLKRKPLSVDGQNRRIGFVLHSFLSFLEAFFSPTNVVPWPVWPLRIQS